MKKILMAATAAVLLSACAAGPGKGDVEGALGRYVEEAGGADPVFEDLEVGKCEEASPGYACSVTGKLTVAMGRRTQTDNLVGTFVFDEVDGEWRVVGQR